MKYILMTLILAGALAAVIGVPRKSCPLPARTDSGVQLDKVK